MGIHQRGGTRPYPVGTGEHLGRWYFVDELGAVRQRLEFLVTLRREGPADMELLAEYEQLCVREKELLAVVRSRTVGGPRTLPAPPDGAGLRQLGRRGRRRTG
jgi:hypothetical protein